MRFLLSAAAVLTFCGPLVAQTASGRDWAERMIVVVPMTGKGTFEDPVRPALPVEQLDGRDGVGYRYEMSDDKRSAIVFLTSARVGARRRAQGIASEGAGARVGLAGH